MVGQKERPESYIEHMPKETKTEQSIDWIGSKGTNTQIPKKPKEV